MSHPRLVLAALALTIAAAPPAAAQLIDYGVTELGQVRTACLGVCFGTGCSGSGVVSSIDVGPPFFVRGIRRGSASDPLCTEQGGSQVTLPAPVGANQVLVFDVDLVPTVAGDVQDTVVVNGTPLRDLEANIIPVTSCSPSAVDSLCLTDDRFKTRVHWRTEFGTRGKAQTVPFGSDDSGLFYFFNENNWEMLIKVLDACAPPFDRFWVFAAATTNVEYTITVVDTDSQQVKTYFNPLGNPAQPIQDTAAFATCP